VVQQPRRRGAPHAAPAANGSHRVGETDHEVIIMFWACNDEDEREEDREEQKPHPKHPAPHHNTHYRPNHYHKTTPLNKQSLNFS